MMNLGKGTRVSVGLSSSPLGLFSGSTRRLKLFRLTLLFVEVRILKRTPQY